MKKNECIFREWKFPGLQKVLRIMKITVFLLLLSVISVFASKSYSQTTVLNLDMKNSTVKEVLRNIEKQSEFVFMYSEKLIDVNREVSVTVKNKKINEVLDELFAGTDVSYKVKDRFVLLTTPGVIGGDLMAQQQNSVSGTVTDESGQPLPGVTVVIKGSTEGTVTNTDGEYSFAGIPDDVTLVFSFVGMKTQEVVVGTQAQIDITMEEDFIGIEEVVAIGYGTMKKSDLTGAIAQINPQDMEEKITSNMTDLLRSNMAGLYIPMSTSPKGGVDMDNVLIRGTTSLLASNSPLIVLDGMVYGGDLANISSADIERIDVLKDASSAAIYGSRAANGVIIITTKQGASGEPTINLSLNTGLATPSFLRPVYGPEGYLDMRQVWSEENLPRDEVGYYSNPNNLPSGVTLEQWMAYGNATGNPTDVWLARIGLFQTEINNHNAGRTMDWADKLFQSGLRQDYLLSVNGGNERFKYYWSANYTDNEGFAVGQKYNSIRSRINLESKVSSFLTIGMNTQFASRDESSVPVDVSFYPWLSPYGSLYEEDGETLKYLTHDFNVSFNPFYDREYINRFNKIQDLDSRLYATIDLPAGFSYQVNFINTFSDTRFYQHEAAESEAISNGGEASRIKTTYYRWNIDNILKWNKSFGSHDFDLTLLANAEKQQSWRDEMVNSQFFPSDILGYHGMQIGQDPRITSDDQTYTRDALLGRLNYTFASRYLLTMAMRRDGYSAFGQSNPYAYFPTVAVGWILTEEDFFNVEPIDYLKLRLSWGANGNSSIGTYSALATMESRKFLHSVDGNPATVSELRLARMANTGLQWEKTTAYNLGIDFGIFGNKLNGTLEGYLSETTNLLVDRKLPSVTGYGAVAANLGQIDNKGIEVTLNSVNLEIGNKFSWRSHFNASLNKNKIASLYGDMVDVLDDQGNVIGQEEASDYENGWFIGQPIDVIWDFDSDGIWQIEEADQAEAHGGYFPGQFKNVDVNNDGTYDSEDRQFLGNSIPQFRWNLTNNFKIYQNISFSFSIYGHHGHIAHFGDYAGSNLFETGNGFDVPYWTPENRSNKYPGMRGAGGTNYLSLGFVRLNDISLGYTFPQHVASRLQLKSLKIMGSVNNVHVWKKWPGWDPETVNPDNSGGPSPRYFNLSVNISL